MKFWLIVLLVGGLFWWVRQRLFAQRGPSRAARPAGAPAEVHTVKCAYCGAFFPPDEGVCDGGRHYCSPAHRAQAMRAEGNAGGRG